MQLYNPFYAATALCGVLLAQGASAQTQSPFGRASPEQERAALAADQARLAAVRQWQNLPQQQKDRLIAQIAPLNQEQRTALLRSLPAFRNLTAEQLDAVLAEVAKDAPLPVAVTVQLGLAQGTIVPVMVGAGVDVTIKGEWQTDAQHAVLIGVYLINQEGTTIGFNRLQFGTRDGGGNGRYLFEGIGNFTVDQPNPTLYAEVSFYSQSGQITAVRSTPITIPTQ